MERKMSQSSFWEIMNQMRLEDTLCDVVLKAGGVKFRAHRNILAACSDYFRITLTKSHWMCSQQFEYTFPEVSPDIMEVIVDYAYSYKAHITSENVLGLLAAADQLGIMGIVSLCCTFLETQLCPTNCIGICRISEWYSCHELYEQAFSYTLQHFEEVVQEPAEEFLQLTLLQLIDILGRDKLNVSQEEIVFEAILKWINHAPALRSGCITLLLPKVRMGLMNGSYLLDNVRKNPLVNAHLECQRFTARVLKVLLHICKNGLTETCIRNPISRPRLPHSILFAIGGWNGNIGGPTKAIEVYDSKADRWMPVPWAEEEKPIAYHGTAFLDEELYVIGGFNGTEHFSTVRKFNLITQTWHEVAHMQFPRSFASVAVLDGHIYVMGGFDGEERLSIVERYDPKTNQWILLPPMHVDRSDADATTLNGKVYVCGGFNGMQCLFTAECFDPLTNRWTRIAPMQSSRSGLGVVAFNQRVISVGGCDGLNRLQTAEAYDPESDSWSELSPMLHSRSNFGIEVLDDRLFVAGGFNGQQTITSAEYYDATMDKWFVAQDMHVQRSALKCCVVSGLPNIADYSVQRYTFRPFKTQ